jgi:hypothetical protein
MKKVCANKPPLHAKLEPFEEVGDDVQEGLYASSSKTVPSKGLTLIFEPT